MESIFAAVYWAGLLGTVMLVFALPLFIAARLLPFPTVRQCATLVVAVFSITTYLALVGYASVPARYFMDEPLRGINDPFWEMHGDELTYAGQHPPQTRIGSSPKSSVN